MHDQLPDEQLKKKILAFGSAAREHRQVAKRLLELLPQRAAELTAHSRQKKRAAQTRWALTSPEYDRLIREYSDIAYVAQKAKINFDTHTMLLKARYSLRRWPKT